MLRSILDLARRRDDRAPVAPVMGELGGFEFEGRHLAYESYGQGDHVFVFLHGLLVDSHLNHDIARALAARGQRVVLLDLLGHGRSDKPTHAVEYRIDNYARQVVGLLDHLGLADAVLGGVSLGANVSLFAASRRPDRVRGLVIEMPVLERAVPAAALTFAPMLIAVRYSGPLARSLARLMQRVPHTGRGPLDSVINAAARPPRATASILHGILVGPVAPTVDERRAITAPTLILGHRWDLIHPFNDAVNLANQLPHARMVRAKSLFELRLRPTRLVGEIASFVEEVNRGARKPRRLGRAGSA